LGHPSGWTVRQTTSQDRDGLTQLIASARWKHLHLDWVQPHQLAGQVPFLLAHDRGMPSCALGCPPDPPGVAWIRVLAAASSVTPEAGWQALWPPARARLREIEARVAAALVSAGWMERLLLNSGFSLQNEVIFLERRLGGAAGQPRHPGQLRPIRPVDLPAVLAVDQAAFADVWRFSSATLSAALESAGQASLAEVDGQAVAYQITTESPFGAHLARLAVAPGWQGRSLGRALTVDSLQWAEGRGLEVLTVNTQADNAAGRRLYRSLGFLESGQVFPMYELPLVDD
jgi:ribosomal protein S18 acetylase RimI-like enzyme